MRRLSTRSFVLVVTLLASAGLAAAWSAQAGLNGDWTITFDTPQGAMDAGASFKVEGDKVTGTLEGPAGSAPMAGTVKENAFTCNFEIQTGQGPLSIAMEGTVDGDALKGTFNFGQGAANFTGKRQVK